MGVEDLLFVKVKLGREWAVRRFIYVVGCDGRGTIIECRFGRKVYACGAVYIVWEFGKGV